MADPTRFIPVAALLGACTQSAPAPEPGLAEISDQLIETNMHLAAIGEKLDAIESRLDARDREMDARLEALRPTPRPPPPPAPPIDDAKLDEGIQCEGAVCKIDRSLLDEVLANPTSLARSARVIPAMEGSVQRGLKLYGIRSGSLPARLGFDNGDRLLTVNGFSLDAPDQALEAYSKLRSADKLTVAIERRGTPRELIFEIR